MKYPTTKLEPMITIDTLVSMFYFEFNKDYVFTGEQHNFWELLYVDKGEVLVKTDDTFHHLKQGMMIFHKPNEFHSIHANNIIAPNLIVLSFETQSKAIRAFENKIISIGDEERNLLAQIIAEGAQAFVFPFRIPLQRRQGAQTGSEQLVELYLTTLLIRLLRQMNFKPSEELTQSQTNPLIMDSSSIDQLIMNGATDTSKVLSSAPKLKQEDEQVQQVINYMYEKLQSKLSLSEISEALHLSITRLQLLFKQKTGFTMMDYFSKLKIEQAKSYIREESYNFTEIADKLGFSSVHTFSKAFKKLTNMNPTEYAKSVKARLGSKSDEPVQQPKQPLKAEPETAVHIDQPLNSQAPAPVYRYTDYCGY